MALCFMWLWVPGGFVFCGFVFCGFGFGETHSMCSLLMTWSLIDMRHYTINNKSGQLINIDSSVAYKTSEFRVLSPVISTTVNQNN